MSGKRCTAGTWWESNVLCINLGHYRRGVPDRSPRSNLSLRQASHLWDVRVDLHRSICDWIFAKNLPGDSPDDLGGVCDTQVTLFGHSGDSQKK